MTWTMNAPCEASNNKHSTFKVDWINFIVLYLTKWHESHQPTRMVDCDFSCGSPIATIQHSINNVTVGRVLYMMDIICILNSCDFTIVSIQLKE